MKYNIKYVISREEGKVIAYCDNWKAQVNEEVIKRGLTQILPFLVSPLARKSTVLNAATKVKGEDIFDEELGKKIARAKLLVKINKSIESIFNETSDKLYDDALKIEELNSTYFIKHYKSRESFKKLGKINK